MGVRARDLQDASGRMNQMGGCGMGGPMGGMGMPPPPPMQTGIEMGDMGTFGKSGGAPPFDMSALKGCGKGKDGGFKGGKMDAMKGMWDKGFGGKGKDKGCK